LARLDFSAARFYGSLSTANLAALCRCDARFFYDYV
jgi:hypothetical protein